MRYALSLAVLLLAQIGAAWAIGDTDIARPGGAYSTVETETAAACERLCTDDTLCMAWSFRGHVCELKAIVPAAITETGTVSGLSPRAPASMRARTEVPAIVAEDADVAAAPAGDDSVAMALLGGPEDDEGLRSRLGN